MNTQFALNSYANVQTKANAGVATPHQLIQMLYDGCIERIAQAKGAMQYKQIEAKGKRINQAIAILNGLRENLDKDQAEDITDNLDALYLYTQSILSKAHATNSTELLDEAAELLTGMSDTWRQIAPKQ